MIWIDSPHNKDIRTWQLSWPQNHSAKAIPYPKLDEEEMQMPMAAEDIKAKTTNLVSLSFS